MSLSTKLLSMLLIRAAVNAYRKLKLSITISEYSTTQRSLCGKEKRYSTQHTIPQNLNLKNILTKPSHLLGLRAVAAFPKNGILKIYYVPGHTTLSSKGKIQYPHYPHIPQQSHTAKPSGTAAQFHSTFRSGNPDNPTSIASHITVSSYTATLSQCHFRSIIQSIPHTLQHQEISTFRSVTHALVVSQQTHAVMFRLLLFYTESC